MDWPGILIPSRYWIIYKVYLEDIGELFPPDMVLAGDLMTSCMDILKPAIMQSDDYAPSDMKILIGMVKGDVHDIGNNMVKMLWISSDFEVLDRGVDVSASTILQETKEVSRIS